MTKIIEHLKTQVGKEISDSPSPFTKWLKGILIEIKPDFLSMEFIVREEMANGLGNIHGGVVSAIIDEMIGANVYINTFEKGEIFVSLNLNVDFLSRAKIGEKLIAEAKIIRKGRKIINSDCVVYNQEQKLVAKGSSNLIKIDV